MTSETLKWLLAQLGESTDTADLDNRYQRLHSARAVALEVLRIRIAALIGSPLKVTLTGVVSVDNSSNVTAMQAQIAALEAGNPAAPDDPPTGPVGDSGPGWAAIRLVPTRRTR
jgi:hypothetical protein